MMSNSDWWDEPTSQAGGGSSTGGTGSDAATRAETWDTAPAPAGYPMSGDTFEGQDSFGAFSSDDDYGAVSIDYTPPRSTPLTMLYLAVGAAVAGLLIGLVVNYLISDRATGATVTAAALGWLLAGVVAVLGVARFQLQEMKNAVASTFYTPNASAALLRIVPLVIGAVGVILTSYYIADWVARR